MPHRIPANDSAPPLQLGPADAGEILALQRAAYVTEAQLHSDVILPPFMQTLAELVAEIDDPNVTVWGYRDGDRLVASTRIQIDRDVAQLRRIAVAHDQKGRGLGTALLTAVQQTLPPTVTAIELFTGEHSEANLRLYCRLGYGELRGEPVGPYSLVHMRKQLNGEAEPHQRSLDGRLE